jgi:starvation-inducible DNA-binding protein
MENCPRVFGIKFGEVLGSVKQPIGYFRATAFRGWGSAKPGGVALAPESAIAWSSQNDIPRDVRQIAVGVLHQQPADALALGMQVEQAHWNVKGPNFIALHELFDEIRQELGDFTADLAERVVALGGIALGTIQALARDSRWEHYPVGAQAGGEHLTLLSRASVRYGKSIREAIGLVEKAGDAGTTDLLTSVARQMNKILWQIAAHRAAAT